MSELTPERLREIEARCEAATPGPLHCAGPCVRDEDDHDVLMINCKPWSWEPNYGERSESQIYADAQFFAAAITDIPDLLAYVKKLRDERDGLRSAIQAFLDGEYLHPKKYRPNHCQHGTEYWQECARCDIEYFERVLADPAECLKVRDAEKDKRMAFLEEQLAIATTGLDQCIDQIGARLAFSLMKDSVERYGGFSGGSAGGKP
jgi:hypothetical protein